LGFRVRVRVYDLRFRIYGIGFVVKGLTFEVSAKGIGHRVMDIG
jgi:hypothetical protein